MIEILAIIGFAKGLIHFVVTVLRDPEKPT